MASLVAAMVVMVCRCMAAHAMLDRIRKGSGVVYLEQARAIVGSIHQIDCFAAPESDQSLIHDVLRSQQGSRPRLASSLASRRRELSCCVSAHEKNAS
jgi:hypothetical protein